MLPFTTLLLLIPIKIAALVILARGTSSGELKPNRVSLFLWSLPSLISFSISFLQGATFSALPLLLSGLAPLGILFLSFWSKHSGWETRPVDYLSGAFSIAALILWLVIDNPVLATCAAILADIFAGIPTFLKTWVAPKTESVTVYLLGALGTLIGLSTLRVWTFATAGFSGYLFVFSLFMIALIIHKKISRTLSRII